MATTAVPKSSSTAPIGGKEELRPWLGEKRSGERRSCGQLRTGAARGPMPDLLINEHKSHAVWFEG